MSLFIHVIVSLAVGLVLTPFYEAWSGGTPLVYPILAFALGVLLFGAYVGGGVAWENFQDEGGWEEPFYLFVLCLAILAIPILFHQVFFLRFFQPFRFWISGAVLAIETVRWAIDQIRWRRIIRRRAQTFFRPPG